MGVLSPEERTAFGEALWDQRWVDWDDPTALPPLWGWLPTLVLHLPAPVTLDVPQRVRAYLLSLKATLDQDWVMSCRLVSALSGVPTRQPATPTINWSPDDAHHLLQRCVTWWDHHHAQMESASPLAWTFDAETRDTWQAIVELLAWVIVPGVRAASAEAHTMVDRLVAAIQAAGMPQAMMLWPATLAWRPATRHKLCRSLVDEMCSSHPDTVRYALYGAYHWALFAQLDQAPSLPSVILQTWTAMILLRRTPALRTTLALMAELIREWPQVLTAAQRQAVLGGVAALLDETTIVPETNDAPSVASAVTREERLAIRTAAAQLASALYHYPCRPQMPR